MTKRKVGRPSKCGSCGKCKRCERAAYMKRWYASKTDSQKKEMLRQRDQERVRRVDRDRYRDDPARRAYVAERTAAWEARNPEEKKVHARVARAVKNGSLVKGPCEQEDEGDCYGVINAHHDDYNKPLDVRWLCRSHHIRWHVENGPGKRIRKKRSSNERTI